MIAGILAVAGLFATHFIPVIGPALGGGFDSLAAIVQIIGRSTLG